MFVCCCVVAAAAAVVVMDKNVPFPRLPSLHGSTVTLPAPFPETSTCQSLELSPTGREGWA